MAGSFSSRFVLLAAFSDPLVGSTIYIFSQNKHYRASG
jgi:hypothetical protein